MPNDYPNGWTREHIEDSAALQMALDDAIQEHLRTHPDTPCGVVLSAVTLFAAHALAFAIISGTNSRLQFLQQLAEVSATLRHTATQYCDEHHRRNQGYW
jgi:hypothetical protein